MNFLRNNKVLLILFFSAFVLRLILVFTARSIATDGCSYIWLAEDILKGDFKSGINAYLPPLLPILTAGASFIFGNLELSARMVSCLAGSLTIFPLFLLVRDIFDKRVAIVTTIFYIIHPYLLQASAEVLTEALYFFLITSLVYILFKAIKSRKLILFMLVGLIAFLIFLARPEGITVIVLVLGWIWFPNLSKIKKEYRWKLAASFFCLIIYIVALLPFYLHFHKTTGSWKPTLRRVTFLDDRIENESWPDMIKRILKWKISVNVPTLFSDIPQAYYPAFLIPLLFGLINRKSYKGFRAGEGFILSFILFRTFIITIFAGVADRYFYAFVPMALSWAGVGFWEINDRFLRNPKVKIQNIGKEKICTASIIIFCIIVAACLPKGLRPIRANRATQKAVGLWMKGNAGMSEFKIAARKPQEAFYAGAEFYCLKQGKYEDIIKQIREEKADFLIVDKDIKTICPDFWDSMNENDLEPFSSKFEDTNKEIIIYKIIK